MHSRFFISFMLRSIASAAWRVQAYAAGDNGSKGATAATNTANQRNKIQASRSMAAS